MSTKSILSKFLQDSLGSSAGIEDEDRSPNPFDNDEEGTVILIHRPPTKFDKICDAVSAQISLWKGGALVTEQDCDAALMKMDSLKLKHHELQVRTSAISQELLEVKQLLRAEVIARKADIKKLSDEVQDLKKDKLELRRIMLVRALSTSLQHHLTVQFPGLFTTKYTFSCTFDDIVAKVTKSGDAIHQQTLKKIEQLFIDEGVELEDIAPMIKQIRELGTSTSHPRTMVSVTGEEYVPSSAQLEEMISVVSLEESLKKDAKVLLNVLRKVVQSDAELFYSKV